MVSLLLAVSAPASRSASLRRRGSDGSDGAGEGGACARGVPRLERVATEAFAALSARLGPAVLQPMLRACGASEVQVALILQRTMGGQLPTLGPDGAVQHAFDAPPAVSASRSPTPNGSRSAHLDDASVAAPMGDSIGSSSSHLQQHQRQSQQEWQQPHEPPRENEEHKAGCHSPTHSAQAASRAGSSCSTGGAGPAPGLSAGAAQSIRPQPLPPQFASVPAEQARGEGVRRSLGKRSLPPPCTRMLLPGKRRWKASHKRTSCLTAAVPASMLHLLLIPNTQQTRRV
jgi:hypothetical protein